MYNSIVYSNFTHCRVSRSSGMWKKRVNQGGNGPEETRFVWEKIDRTGQICYITFLKIKLDIAGI